MWIAESRWMEKSNVWYNAFKWWGDRKWFGLIFVERYEHSQKVKKVLNDSILKVQKKYSFEFEVIPLDLSSILLERIKFQQSK